MKKITRGSLRSFLEKHKTDQKILEIGGGDTSSNHLYTDLFPNRHTIDIDPARKPDTVGDAHALPFDDASFDFILCTEVLEHLHTPQKAIDEMNRVLRPGGTLVLTTRFVYPIHDAPHDYFRYTKYGLKHLFRNWNIEILNEESLSFSTIGALLQRIGFQTRVKGGRVTKGLIYFFAYLCTLLDSFIKSEYGDIQKSKEEEGILTTGYHLVAKKRL